MADKTINDLVPASGINDDDLFVLQQGATARSISGELLKTFIEGLGVIRTVSYNPTNYSITMTFQHGEPFTTGSLRGEQGAQGIQGVSPSVSIAPIATGNGGYAVTIIDADHPTGQTFNIYNGADGAGSVSTVDGISAISGNVTTRTTATATLTTGGWSSLSQAVSVSGVGANDIVIVSPAPESHDDYINASIRCTSQSAGTLTFGCTKLPTSAINVNIVIFKVV